MTILNKPSAKDKSLGIYLAFERTDQPRCIVNVRRDGPFRKYVTIFLPECSDRKKEELFVQALVSMENGHQWPARMNWANVQQFFTYAQLRKLEGVCGLIPFYLYNAQELDRRNIDINAIYNAARRAARKMCKAAETRDYEQLL